MTDSISLAVIASAQGLDGSVKLKLFTHDSDSFKAHKNFNTQRGPLTLASLRIQPNATIARFKEIADRTAAETWRGVELCVEKADLPATGESGEYYYSDLVGLKVISTAGADIGAVSAVDNYGAGDVLEITLESGKAVLVPFRDVAVPHVDIAARVITVDPAFLV